MHEILSKLRRLYRGILRRGQNRVVIISDVPKPHITEPIFIIGCQRSGTSLLRRIVDSHSRIACPPESHFLVPLLDLFEHRRGMLGLESMGFSREAVSARVLNLVDQFFYTYAQSQGKVRWADKTPIYVDYLDIIEELFQGRARYVMLYRHGLDVAYSMCSTLPDFLNTVPNYSRIQQRREMPRIAAAYWREQVKKMRVFQMSHSQRCFELSYNDLTNNSASVLTNMFEFLGEKFETNVLRFNDISHDEGLEDGKVTTTRGFNPSFENYRKWQPSQLQAALEETESLLSDLGYSV
jgi:protein-tyrosine sulfotransferase